LQEIFYHIYLKDREKNESKKISSITSKQTFEDCVHGQVKR